MLSEGNFMEEIRNGEYFYLRTLVMSFCLPWFISLMAFS
jgi:hypothetical protein